MKKSGELLEALRGSELEGSNEMAEQLQVHMESYQKGGPDAPSERDLMEYVKQAQELYKQQVTNKEKEEVVLLF